MGGYVQALEGAADGVPVRTVRAWHLNPAFVDVLASRIRKTLAAFSDEERDRVPVLMTAHSLPRRVVEREPDYVDQLHQTAEAVAHAAELPLGQWSFAFQSAGHTPEEWLKPDLLDVLPQLAQAGHRRVLVAPVQFLADHLETLYDIDVAGREQALQAGIDQLVRVEAPNAAPDFIDALAKVVRGELAGWDAANAGVAWLRA
jgi:protoporphyrin/coproporphyrin ferrochelatase